MSLPVEKGVCVKGGGDAFPRCNSSRTPFRTTKGLAAAFGVNEAEAMSVRGAS